MTGTLNALSLDKGYSTSPLPDLISNAPALSYFEFWPTWLFYLPMKFYGSYLALRYGGMTLPTITNPLFDAGGFHGESKTQIHSLIPDELHEQIAVTVPLNIDPDKSAEELLSCALELIKDQGWSLPIIVKPDVGLRGMGVQRVFKPEDLLQYIEKYPSGETIIFQDMYDFPCEAGLFYIRKPGEEKGRIFSLTLKYFSFVTGDSRSTLKSLIENHPRYGRIAHVYLPRHKDKWDMVLSDGEQYRIAFAGSHSRGTIFKDGNHLITEKMEESWDKLCKKIPEFYFGRFDIRFHGLNDLETLDNLKIVEINGSGAEATHIWDSKTKLKDAYKTLIEQYRLMFEIGAINKKRGFIPMKLGALLSRIKKADALSELYPHTH